MLKAALRSRIRAARRARPDSEREQCGRDIARHGVTLLPDGPTCVATHLSLPTEPAMDELTAALLAAGHRVLAPRVVGERLEWVELTSTSELAAGQWGIREPRDGVVETKGLAAASVVFVPGLAVDRSGHRLGQGGGYYDRAFAEVPAHHRGGPLRVVVLFDDEVLDDVPAEPHDCRMDAALTPSGVQRIA